jgi:SAM-dependent methyltransferase
MNYARLYEYRFARVAQERRRSVWRTLAPALMELLGNPRRLLDPAAGRLEFIGSAGAEERWGVDAVAHEDGAADAGVRVIVGDITAVELPDSYFDGIFVSNFLEHLPSQDAVAGFLEQMRSALAPGGRILVMGPNFRFCARRYFDFADHNVILTERSVAEHLYAAGFELLVIRARFLPYSFTGRLPSHPALVRAYLGLPLAWRLLGKQFVVVAQRP